MPALKINTPNEISNTPKVFSITTVVLPVFSFGFR